MLLNGGHPLLGCIYTYYLTGSSCDPARCYSTGEEKGAWGGGGRSPDVDLGACSLFPPCVAAALAGTAQWLRPGSHRVQGKVSQNTGPAPGLRSSLGYREWHGRARLTPR